jgi:hypothetical protein
MVVARDAPDLLEEWLRLADEAETLRLAVGPVSGSTVPVSAAIDALLRYEHTLTPAQRQTARERWWLRDDERMLPPVLARTWWAWCQCRSCTLERLTATNLPAVWQAQRQAVTHPKGKVR